MESPGKSMGEPVKIFSTAMQCHRAGGRTGIVAERSGNGFRFFSGNGEIDGDGFSRSHVKLPDVHRNPFSGGKKSSGQCHADSVKEFHVVKPFSTELK